MRKLAYAAVFAATTLAAGTAARAADFNFSGNIVYINDVIRIGFTLASDATNVQVWTDSFQSGTNFDPITAVWSLPTGALVGANDDDPYIAPGQTYFDSGIVFPTLAKGDYLFTIQVFPNHANGTNLADGFQMDNQAQVPLGVGTFWSVHLTGVDAVSTAPEPGTYALLGLGLGVVGWAARRRAA